MTDNDLPVIVSPGLPGPRSRALAERLRRVESPDTTFLSDEFPVFWSHATGCLVYDEDDNSYLDLTSSFGVLGVGHCHPCVVQAIEDQSKRLIHGMGDVHPSKIKVELLEKIGHYSPIKNPLITLGMNGSDAVEAALKTAYLATGKPGVIAFTGGYHGLSYGALEPTARGFFREPFSRQRGQFVQHLAFGCDVQVLAEAVARSKSPIGAVIAEPIQGRAGIQIPPAGWLKSIDTFCKASGILLILDEIFTGWGRTGKWFACQHEDVVPDLMCIGKGMGGGMPLSACLGSPEVMKRAWEVSAGEAKHTYTFLGHPLSSAAAVATIGVIEDEHLVERSEKTGSKLLGCLDKLAQSYPHIICQARGRGMMIGLEFISPEHVMAAVLKGLSKGLILLPAGDAGEVLEIVPPFILSNEQAAFAVDRITEIVDDISCTC